METLRHSGIRIEELLEISQLSIRRCQRPNGQVVALLVVAPSKTDRERVMPMSAELFTVIGAIIRRHSRDCATVPVASSSDHAHSRAGEPAARSGCLQARSGVRPAPSPVGAGRRSAHHWEHEMGDAVALNADRWVAEQHVVSRELAEEGAVALAHHDRDEVDGHLVEQPQV